MNDSKRIKQSRSKNALFNPYKNGISSYDMAYLSAKKTFNKKRHLQNESKEEYFAA